VAFKEADLLMDAFDLLQHIGTLTNQLAFHYQAHDRYFFLLPWGIPNRNMKTLNTHLLKSWNRMLARNKVIDWYVRGTGTIIARG
jgi:hypothetical protein